MNKSLYVLIGCVTTFFLFLILGVLLFDVQPIEGNQLGVLETYWSGVDEKIYTPRTYFVFPWERMYIYNVGQRVFVMDNNPTTMTSETDIGREKDSYIVQSVDNQNMTLEMNLQWRLDPSKLIEVHKSANKYIEEVIIRPIMLRVVKDEATQLKAIEAYSGQGLVQLQKRIEDDLINGELGQKGIIVDSFTFTHIGLDPSYVEEIQLRQIAQQKKLRFDEEEKAAQAEALVAKAKARKAYEEQVVDAERDKAVSVLKAEALNEQEILKAEANKQKTILEAEAKKESSELEAAAILAVGKANAESEKLKFSAYSAEGADLYVKMQVAESIGKGISNVKGYLPESMTIFSIGEDFSKAVEKIVGEKK